MCSNFYPESPTLENDDFLNPSAEFKKVAISVIFSIFAFFIFYLVLIALAVAIMIGAGWMGINIIAYRPSFLTIAAGGGIIALGVMFFIFLIKFVFSTTKNENPQRIRISKKEHPQLFDFVNKLTQDTKTKFPKKIFVSPDVNAMVFYNSSFWSLFFPVRKNLEIGLGLVNSLNVSEFKSVLAHEFGHFSQRSMKIGSYIYTVNRVIYNLVFEYDNWDRALSSWAQTGGIFGFFAGITFWMVERVRSLLRFAYNLLNLNYMKLSREMEYHADLVAVSVAGNNAFKDALRKTEFSSTAYEYAMDHLTTLTSRKKASENIYNNHQFTLNLIAKQNNIGISKGAFQITDEDLERNVIKSRINIKDQWASHPSLQEREQNISQVNVTCTANVDSAWSLFDEPAKLQKSISKHLYNIGFPESKFRNLEELEFEEFVETETNKYKISEHYNGYYDSKPLSKFSPGDLIGINSTVGNFEDIYAKKNVELQKRFDQNKADLELLQQIKIKENKIKYFEFDDRKYKRKDADELIDTLGQQVEEEEKRIEKMDQESFLFNYNAAAKTGSENELLDLYEAYFSSIAKLETFSEIYAKFQHLANALFSQPQWTEDEIKQMSMELSNMESECKNYLKRNASSRILSELENQEQREVVKEYLNSDNYFIKTYEFDQESFINFMNLITDLQTAFGANYGKAVKQLTDFQLQFHELQ